MAHPGELLVLEHFAIAVQKRIIAAAGGACGDRPVLVHMHTDIQQFIFNQPLITHECEPHPFAGLGCGCLALVISCISHSYAL